MKIHEYQAKKILKSFGVVIANGHIAYTPEEARRVAGELGSPPWVVKAQIHAGGRGKGGGIKLAHTLDEVENYSVQMFQKALVTPQTGPEGKIVRRVYVEKGCKIKQELYLSMLVDRSTSTITMIASAAGGMDIEEVAAHTPEKIIKRSIDPFIGMHPYVAREVAFSLGLQGSEALKCAHMILSSYKAFSHYDASLLEINPFVLTEEGDVLALDAKVTFDDNALMRHPELEELRDIEEEDAMELEAARHSLSYIKLDGNIGCLVNGAGLAMATMDVIKLYGGEPANFLDVGGGAPKDRVATAFKLILSDKNVEGILVNIFGGIMRCDIIAEGIIAAAKDVGINVPLVVRLEGTNVELGKKILASSDLNVISVDDLGEAARSIVQAVKEAA